MCRLRCPLQASILTDQAVLGRVAHPHIDAERNADHHRHIVRIYENPIDINKKYIVEETTVFNMFSEIVNSAININKTFLDGLRPFGLLSHSANIKNALTF